MFGDPTLGDIYSGDEPAFTSLEYKTIDRHLDIDDGPVLLAMFPNPLIAAGGRMACREPRQKQRHFGRWANIKDRHRHELFLTKPILPDRCVVHFKKFQRLDVIDPDREWNRTEQ